MSNKFKQLDLPGKLGVAALKLLGRLPLPVASKLGRAAAQLVWLFAKSPRQVTLRNLELCFPDQPEEERLKLARESLIETTVTAFEMAPAWVQPPEKALSYITHAENEELFKDAMKQNRGIVFIAPHFGNWELANYYMASKSPLMVIYKPSDSEALNKLILKSRTQIGEMVPADKRGVLALFSAIKKGKTTGILPDQEPSLSSGVWVPFFGIPALTPMLVSKLVQKTDAIALGFGCQRNPDGKTFHVFYEPVDEEIYSNDMETSAAAMNRCIERIVLREPSQFQWEYKRFKRRPDRSPNPYR